MTKNEKSRTRRSRRKSASKSVPSRLRSIRQGEREARLRDKRHAVRTNDGESGTSISAPKSNVSTSTGQSRPGLLDLPAADPEIDLLDSLLLGDGEPRSFIWDGRTITRVRITARAKGDDAVDRLGGGDSKSNEAIERLQQGLSKPMTLGGPTTPEAIDELAAALHAEAPHFRLATGKLYPRARTHIEAGTPWLAHPPLLLVGAPGIGKSQWARRLAALARLPATVIDAGAMTSPAPLIGIDGSWRGARPSLLLLSMQQHRRANLICVVDEVDKMTSFGAPRDSSPDSILLGLLEPTTAHAFEDSYLRQPVNMSFVNWILTANDLEGVSPPIRDRRLVIQIDPITAEDFEHLALRQIEQRELDRDLLPIVLRGFRSGQIKSLRKLNKVLDAAGAAMSRPMLN